MDKDGLRRRFGTSRHAIFMIDSKQQKLLTAKAAEKSRKVRKENQRTVQEVSSTQPKVFLCDLRAPFCELCGYKFCSSPFASKSRNSPLPLRALPHYGPRSPHL